MTAVHSVPFHRASTPAASSRTEPQKLLPLDVIAHLGEFMKREDREPFLNAKSRLPKRGVDLKEGFFQTECTLLSRKMKGITNRIGQGAPPLSFEEVAALTYEMEGGPLHLNVASCHNHRGKTTPPHFMAPNSFANSQTIAYIDDHSICVADQESFDDELFVKSPPRISYTKPGQKIEAMAVDPEGQRMVFVSRSDKKIEIETWRGGLKDASIPEKSKVQFSSQLAEDSDCLLTSRFLAIQAPDCVEIFDVEKGKIHSVLSYNNATFSYVDEKQGYILFADRKGFITMRNFLNDTGKAVLSEHSHRGDLITAMTVSTDGQSAISADNDEIIKVWNIQTGSCIRTLFPRERTQGQVIRALYSSPDSESVLAMYWNGKAGLLKRWDLRTGLCSQPLHLPLKDDSDGAPPLDAPIMLTPDATRVLYRDRYEYKIFDLATHQRLAILPNAESYALSTDGMYLRRIHQDTHTIYSLYSFERSTDFSLRKKIYTKTATLLEGLGHDRLSPIQQQGKQARTKLLKDRILQIFWNRVFNPTVQFIEHVSKYLFIITLSVHSSFALTDLATLFLTVKKVAYLVNIISHLTLAVFGISFSIFFIGGAITSIAYLIAPKNSPTTAKTISISQNIMKAAFPGMVIPMLMILPLHCAEIFSQMWVELPLAAIGYLTSKTAFRARIITYLTLGFFQTSFGFAGGNLTGECLKASPQHKKIQRILSKTALVATVIFTLTGPVTFLISVNI